MSSITRVPEAMAAAQTAQAGKVKTLSTLALALAVIGIFVPFAAVLIEAAAFLTATYAMKVSRAHGLDLEYEKRAAVARVISGVFFVLWTIFIVFTLL